ncbi:DNA polymerase III subunit chi [Candidatus Palibaumannia cicadellinicola]|uniref:DNA polymerase III chi subunit n=1 Tax=Candidatus Palibaumannia cicadellinicola TaxID=186490 RepID=A0A0K2BKV8_9GAMM|nr:DNA polymerase III subunit chi [Candidatus Baumannia cicadellinicola]AKZ65834.1 DNA polymerase III chi subunit [Candidatus Baumannia cicadellinicola]
MKTATFYLINNNIKNELIAIERLACYLAILKWRAGKRILIACVHNKQARKLDDALWAYTPTVFIPHNIVGEGPTDGAPVEICWPTRLSPVNSDLLISLLPTCAKFASFFNEVIDFIPNEESLKQLARTRYKVYRKVGFQLTITPPPQ